MENDDCDLRSLIELKTKEDGDSFFHAVFGEELGGVFQTRRSKEMRVEWYNFLHQFTDLSDKSMPHFLKEQLKKIFNLFFLDILNSEGLSRSSIRELVGNKKLAIAEAETKAAKLVQDILEQFLIDECFRNNIFNITLKARSTEIAETPLVNDLLDDLNRQLLKNEIRNCLESCALFYLSISKEQYNQEYNSEFIANSLFESQVFYMGYLEAIQSSSYFVMFEEVPIIASLANIEISICYEDVAVKNKLELFKPNAELLELRTSYNWTEKRQEIIIYKLNHFSRAQHNPLQNQDGSNALLRSSIGCQTKSPEQSTSQGKVAPCDVDVYTSHTRMVASNSFECDDLEGLPDPSSFNIHRFTSKATDKTQGYHFQSLQESPANNLRLTNYSLEQDVLKFGYPSTTRVVSPENKATPFAHLQHLSGDFELLAFQDQSFKRRMHILTGKSNLVIKEMNTRTGTFYHGELDADNKMSGTGRLSTKDGKQYIDGDWRNDRLIKINVCKFLYPSSRKTVYSKIDGEEGLLTLCEDHYVARVSIGDLKDIDFGYPNASIADIQRMMFKKVTILKILEDKKSSLVDASYNHFKQLLHERSSHTANALECAEDIVQLYKTLDTFEIKIKDFSLHSNILQHLATNMNISTELRNATEQLFRAETSLHARNRTLLQTSLASKQYSSHSENLLKDLQQICRDVIEHHRKALLDKCNSNAFLPIVRSSFFKLSSLRLLCISSHDIQLFSDLVNIANNPMHNTCEAQPEVTSLLLEVVRHFWDIMIEQLQNPTLKIDSINQVSPLTNPIYLGLYKSFIDLMIEMCMKTHMSARDLLINRYGAWMLAGTSKWQTPHKHKFLERQLRFIFKLLEHFKPCLYRNRKQFYYNLKLLKDERTVFSKWKDSIFGNKLPKPDITAGLSEEQLIWLYIVDDAMASIIQWQKEELKLSKESEEQITNFAMLLLKNFVKFISLGNNRYESFRVLAHNIIKFVAQVSPHFVEVSEGGLDHSILLKQISYMKFTISQQDCKLLDCFPFLISVFSAYWDCKVSILSHISELLPYEKFNSDKEEMSQRILEIVDTGLDQKVNSQVLTKFFRMFNELLKLLQAVKFEWIIKELARTNELLSNNVLSLVNADKNSYLVMKPKEFIEDCEASAGNIPRHYIIEIVKKLFATIHSSLAKTDLDTEANMNSTCKLILSIGHSFIHFEDQSDYVDLDQFLADCTLPFIKVLENRSSYQDFEKRIDNIETFYLYTRIQDEIDITKALDLFKSEAEALHDSGFDTTFNKDILQSCCEKYREQFNSYIERTSNDETNIHIILEDISKMVKLTDNVDIDKWTPEFKQNTLPLILAGLGAVWSIRNSKDIISTGKSLKPHCIQILCILRLLSVDQASVGMGKHLAQILTGQGKSVVLGFLSTILALLGYPVRVVCYSEYLASRDKLAFTEIFEEFQVSEKIVYGTFDDMADAILSPEIGGRKQDIRTLVNKCVLDKLGRQSDSLKTTVTKSITGILLIDEVDVFFSDTFYGNTYNGGTLVHFPALLEIQTEIWKIVSSGMHTPDAVLKQIDGPIKRIVQKNEDEEFSTFLSTTEFLFKKHLKMMIDDAIAVATSSAYSSYFNMYGLSNNGMIMYREKDGLYSTCTFWNYYNVFNYFKLKQTDYDHKHFNNFGYLTISCGQISYASLPKEYSIISGVSGTLTTLNGPEKEAIKSYDVKSISCMPSFFGRSKLVFNEIEHFTQEDFEENWLTTIYNHVSAMIQHGRSVIVFFSCASRIANFKKLFESNIDCLHVLTGNEDPPQLEWIVNEAGVARTVTLATRLMGRGVDFKSNDSSVEAKGGVHIIQTFFSLDEKEEVQIKGRTARKSNNGSYELILCTQHLKRDILVNTSSNSYQDLCCRRKIKAEEKGKGNSEKIRMSQEKHNKTLEYIYSFANYTPDKRDDYLQNPILK